MKKMSVKILALSLFTLGLSQSPAQVLLTTVTNTAYTYTQNFNSLPTQAGATTLTSNVWVNNSTLTGWYCNISNSVTPVIFGASGACTNILGGTGSSSTGGFYSYGTNGVNANSDRAIGAIQANAFAASGAPSMAYGVRFTNDTGVAMTNFTITYTGEEWRVNGNAAVQSLLCAYRVDSAPITNADVGSSSTWNTVAALQFNSPVTAGTAGLDGNAAANRTTLTATLTGVVVLPGQEIFVRWLDTNDSGNDHALAIDDVIVTFTNTIASASAPTITVNPASQTLREGDTLTASASVSGTQPISFYWCSIVAGVTNLVGTVNPQSIFTYVTTSQTGNQYFVIASNSVGIATSATATLTVTSSVPTSATIAFLRTLRHPTTYAVTDQTNLYQIDGIVTTPNLLTGPLQSYFVQDATGGIDVFNRDGAFPLPAVGDHVRITGPLFNFNGLLELNITNANPSHHVVNLGAGTLPAPVLFDFNSQNNPTLMENSLEGTLAYVTNVFLNYTNSTFFIAGTTIKMTNALGKRFDISIPSDSIGDMVNKQLQTPPFAASVLGVLSQNTTSVPTNGYSLAVFAYANIQWTNNVAIVTPLNISGGGTNQVISWPLSLMSLASSTNVTGPYVVIPGASSPYTNDATTNAMNFFRLVY